jgi:hypothetical protein
MAVTALRIGLIVLGALVALTAIPSAFLVVPTMPPEWIKAGPFTDWTVPAIALFSVGMLAAAAVGALLARPWAGALASIVAGAAMVVFELVEIGVVGWTLTDPTLSGFQKSLQVVYLVVGSLQIILALVLWARTRHTAPAIPFLHEAPAG